MGTILTPERKALKDRITVMWADGLSAGQIAIQEGLTRCQVMGHVHRLKLPRRSTNAARQQGIVCAAKQKSKVMPFVFPAEIKAAPFQIDTTEIEPPLKLDGKLITLDTLHHSKMCKYPLGDPGTDSFHFCANATKPGSHYCLGHHKRCYTPVTGISKVDPAILRNSDISRALG